MRNLKKPYEILRNLKNLMKSYEILWNIEKSLLYFCFSDNCYWNPLKTIWKAMISILLGTPGWKQSGWLCGWLPGPSVDRMLPQWTEWVPQWTGWVPQWTGWDPQWTQWVPQWTGWVPQWTERFTPREVYRLFSARGPQKYGNHSFQIVFKGFH